VSRPSLVALAALAALAPACRRHRHRPRAAAPSAAGRWSAAVADADALQVIDGHYLAGVVRRTRGATAPPPYPARPLVSAARVADGWRFAAADGTLYAAADFLAPLRVVAAAPESARPPSDGLARGLVRGVFHEGALGYVDHAGRAWVLDGSTARALPLAHVVSLVFTSATTALAVTSPGGLHRSDDRGRRFAAVALPDGDLATAVGLVNGAAVVESYRSRYVPDAAGALAPAEGAASLEAYARATAPAAADAPPALVLPTDPARVAALPDGTLAIVEGDAVRVVDPRTRRELRRAALPGQGCVIAPAHGSFRLVCTHDGWAGAIFAPRPDGGWTTLRDELRAEPMGDAIFDDASGAWVVAAPCAQQPVRDPAAFCVRHADGATRTVFAPFAAQPVDLRGGAALLVETSAAGQARAVVLRGEAMTVVALPVGSADARGLRWSAGALAVWGRGDDGRPVLHRGSADATGAVRWSAHPAPAGARRGILGVDGAAYALGGSAAALWAYRPGAGFAPMAGPVRGDASALALDPEALSYCAGPVCRLAGALEWTAGARGGPWFVARADAPPAPPPPWVAPPRRAAERTHYECAAGATLGSGPELDHGIAVSGYALHWTPERDGVTVQWIGDPLSHVTRGRLPPTAERVSFSGYAPVGATTPIALVDRCAGARCETFVASATGVQPFPLEHFALPYRRDLLLGAGATFVALSRGVSHGATVAQAIAFDATDGALVARRTVVSDAPPEFVQAGALDGRDGLWVPVSPRRWRFVPLSGEGPDDTVDDDGTIAPCPAGVASRGVMRRLDRGAELQGAGWAPVVGEWQVEERLAVTARGLCLEAIAGGESRDESAFEHRGGESDPVRSFALTSDGAGGLTGVAWQGRRRFAMTCARVEARRTLAR
jgi:hypothetical protein